MKHTPGPSWCAGTAVIIQRQILSKFSILIIIAGILSACGNESKMIDTPRSKVVPFDPPPLAQVEPPPQDETPDPKTITTIEWNVLPICPNIITSRPNSRCLGNGIEVINIPIGEKCCATYATMLDQHAICRIESERCVIN